MKAIHILLAVYINILGNSFFVGVGKHDVLCSVGLKILVFSAGTLELKASFRVTTTTSSTTALKSIEFARRGK